MKPISRLEKFLAKIAGYEVKISPKSRKEYFLNEIAKNSGSSVNYIERSIIVAGTFNEQSLIGSGELKQRADITDLMASIPSFSGSYFALVNDVRYEVSYDTDPEGMQILVLSGERSLLGITFATESTNRIYVEVYDESLFGGFSLTLAANDETYLDNAYIVPKLLYKSYDVTLDHIEDPLHSFVAVNGARCLVKIDFGTDALYVYESLENAPIMVITNVFTDTAISTCTVLDLNLLDSLSVEIKSLSSHLDRTVREIINMSSKGPVVLRSPCIDGLRDSYNYSFVYVYNDVNDLFRVEAMDNTFVAYNIDDYPAIPGYNTQAQ